MKKYLEDLKNELKKRNVSDREIEEILADHVEMIAEALAEGLTEEEIYSKFGSPEKLAADIAEASFRSDVEESDHESMTLFKSFPTPSSPISIEINLISEDVRIEVANVTEISVYYEGIAKLDLYRCTLQNGKFVLSRNDEHVIRLFRNNHDDMRFFVVIPLSVIITTMEHDSVSSDIELQRLSAKNIHINSTSGDLKLNKLTADDFNLSTVSGDVNLTFAHLKSFDLSVVSGDAKLEGLSVSGDIRANTVSGDLSFENSECVNLSLRTVSGDITGTNFYPTTISLSSVSGDITLSNDDQSRRIEIRDKNSISGNIRINGRH